jgi:hypothetical protein
MIKRLIMVSFFVGWCQAMVFDNRFFPLLFKPYSLKDDSRSRFTIQPFFMQADRAFSEVSRLNIPDICGHYDQRVLAQTFPLIGQPDPLRSDFQLRTAIPWIRVGRLDAQGVALRYEHAFHDCFSVGFDTLFMHAAMRHEFLFSDVESRLPLGDKNYLLQSKEQINQALGLCPPLFSKTGFGDIDLYMKFHWGWDYLFKCRRIDSAFKLGLLIPSAQERNIDNPASVPFGGNRHWGVYGSLESEWELRENLTLGLMGRVSKRFKRSDTMRLPLLTEPPEYGALKAPVSVDPGWTFVFNPYVRLEEIREGLGFEVLYYLVAHLEDRVVDNRTPAQKKALPSNVCSLEGCSSWGAEYVSIGAFYDFGEVGNCIRPKLSAYWDIPVGWLVSKRAAKTNSVSLMVELEF